MGERPEGAGAAGALILSGVGAGEVVGRERAPLFRPGRGNREGAREEVGWAGGAAAAQFGPRGAVGGKRALFPFFSFSLPGFCFLFSFYLFISFSVLFHFKAFRHFIKMCSLHHNYQCNIWHPLNIFV